MVFSGADNAGEIIVTLPQTGTTVTGSWVPAPGSTSDPGALTGALDGRVLDGTWTDRTGSGAAHLVFAADGASFTGTWASAARSGAWTGVRSPTPEAEPRVFLAEILPPSP